MKECTVSVTSPHDGQTHTVEVTASSVFDATGWCSGDPDGYFGLHGATLCAMRFKAKAPKKLGQRRTVKITPEMKSALEEQRARFISKFGREPGPGDPVFFDPRFDTPVPMDESYCRQEITSAMGKTDIPPAIIYAYNKTGILLTERNKYSYSPQALEEYDAAIREYHELESKQCDR
jgi:hypothetical protein